MKNIDYLRMIVEDIHSTTIATIDEDDHPQTRVIDMMLYDDKGVYFLTAKGKTFYTQLMQQGFIALSGTKNQKAVSLRGKIKNIGKEKLDEIFEKNPYMQDIYPDDTRKALEVFWLYDASGEYFDISDPKHVIRASIVIGNTTTKQSGYFVNAKCIGCKACINVCPQKCIDVSTVPVVIDQNHCLHCGECFEICPIKAIEKRI